MESDDGGSGDAVSGGGDGERPDPKEGEWNERADRGRGWLAPI